MIFTDTSGEFSWGYSVRSVFTTRSDFIVPLDRNGLLFSTAKEMEQVFALSVLAYKRHVRNYFFASHVFIE
jgi:hypothetical protein